MTALRWRWAPLAELPGGAVYDALALRAEVFVVEQGCAYLDPDGADRAAWHLLGYDGEGLAAVARAFAPGLRGPEAAFGRVATAPRVRGQGLGRLLVSTVMERMAETFGPTPIRIAAQAHLDRFYGAFGFEICGPGFLEDAIPHLPMRREAPG